MSAETNESGMGVGVGVGAASTTVASRSGTALARSMVRSSLMMK